MTAVADLRRLGRHRLGDTRRALRHRRWDLAGAIKPRRRSLGASAALAALATFVSVVALNATRHGTGVAATVTAGPIAAAPIAAGPIAAVPDGRFLPTGDGAAPSLACDATLDIVYQPAGAPFDATAGLRTAAAAAAAAVDRPWRLDTTTAATPQPAHAVIITIAWAATLSAPDQRTATYILGEAGPEETGHRITAGHVRLAADTVGGATETGDGIVGVALHELGHTLGLDHQPDGSDSQMTAGAVTDRAPHWGPQDLADLANLNRDCPGATEPTAPTR